MFTDPLPRAGSHTGAGYPARELDVAAVLSELAFQERSQSINNYLHSSTNASTGLGAVCTQVNA